MFFSKALIAFVALPVFAIATPLAARTDAPNQCNTGSLQCCQQTQMATASELAALTGLLGGALGPVEGLVGANCTPISVIGAGGNSCSAQPVCCTNNSFNGVIALGCTPVNVNL